MRASWKPPKLPLDMTRMTSPVRASVATCSTRAGTSRSRPPRGRGREASHQLGDVQLLAVGHLVVLLGGLETHPRRAVEGPGVRHLVKLAAAGIAPRLEHRPQPPVRPAGPEGVDGLAHRRRVVSEVVDDGRHPPPPGPPASASHRRSGKAGAGPRNVTPSAATTAQAPTAFSTLCRPGTEELTWPKRRLWSTRVKRVAVGHGGRPRPTPRLRAGTTSVQDAAARPSRATARARGQGALTAKKPSGGTSVTKRSNADS